MKKNNPVIIKNTGQYITESTLQSMIEIAKVEGVINVDKFFTGSGFTTAAINMEGIKILIVEPNRATVIQKSESYEGNLCQFAYGNSGFKFTVDKPILMSVLDTALRNPEVFDRFTPDVIFVDEAHTAIIQAGFRKILLNYEEELKRLYPNTPIIKISATPLSEEIIDVKIDFDLSKEDSLTSPPKLLERNRRNITLFQDEDTSVQLLRFQLEGGVTVIAGTNDHKLIHKIARVDDEDGNRILRGNFKIGTTLMRNLVKKYTVIDDKESNLIICSTSAFEGWDFLDENVSMYLFENRNEENTTYTSANVIQFFSRGRKGGKKMVYCRIPRAADNDVQGGRGGGRRRRYHVTIEGLTKKLDMLIKKWDGLVTKIYSKKESGLGRDYQFYYIDTESGAIKIKMHKVIMNNQMIADDSLDAVERYILGRQFNFFTPDRLDRAVVINHGRLSLDLEGTLRMLDSNRKLIGSLKLYEGMDRVDMTHMGSFNRRTKEYTLRVEQITNHLRIQQKFASIGRDTDTGTATPEERYNFGLRVQEYERAIDIFENIEEFSESVLEKERPYLAAKIKDAEYKELESSLKKDTILWESYMKKKIAPKHRVEYLRRQVVQLKINDRRNKIQLNVMKIIYSILSRGVILDPKTTGYRDYSVMLDVGMPAIAFIARELNVLVWEVDIKTAYPRFFYALNGLELPSDYYGTDKRNKVSMNIMLNSISKFTKFGKDTSLDKNKKYKKTVRGNKKKKIIKAGFKKEIAVMLLKEYFHKPRSAFFEEMSYHEMRAIHLFKNQLDSKGIQSMRRHDSLIIFDDPIEFAQVAKDFK